ncbi:dehydrogenase [Sphaerisporangium melleum]|uniref:Dehydrogenase n=1 Tax=Sphaerisporangium melleum TaxID=321316 RepID=A0A917VJL4_9ACTN|nr:SDR family oxidoreductase [Sphaerisporangium melleum]GGK86570.1 dehydrogenase [Sphaerisporangium melleum]GII71523.1 dehydrogenase [Sphaerisporangium melleum]
MSEANTGNERPHVTGDAVVDDGTASGTGTAVAGGGEVSESGVALVTGANKGIGFEVAKQLAERGFTVLLAARDPRQGADAAAVLKEAGLDVQPVVLDVTDPVTIEAAAELVARQAGRLDVLVNNAGISGGFGNAPSQADLDVVREVFETNLFGVIRVTNAMLPLLRRSRAGRIVNLSSGTASLADMADPGHHFAHMPPSAAYPVSKTALNMLTVQYAKELRPEGILVNAAAPGACATDFIAGFDLAMGGGRPPISRTAAQGAAIVVHLATLPDDGPTGAYLHDDGPVRW